MSDITMVTCFFDIGRKENPIENMKRSNDVYVEQFKTWARIKNKLIIYTEKNMADRLFDVRNNFGLGDRTEIIIIDNIYSILPDIYKKMLEIEKDKDFKNFRYYSDAMSNQAKYCYLVLITYWVMKDSVERGLVKEHLAWIDLGYNHGLDFYTKPEEFDFKWEYTFDNKINCFALFDPNTISSIDSLQFQKDCFMGGLTVMHKEKANKLWENVLEAEKSLLNLGCMDDDQQLLLMAYKKYPEDFTIRICDWFEPLLICGCEHLSHRDKKKPTLKYKVISTIAKSTGLKYRYFYRKNKERVKRMY